MMQTRVSIHVKVILEHIMSCYIYTFINGTCLIYKTLCPIIRCSNTRDGTCSITGCNDIASLQLSLPTCRLIMYESLPLCMALGVKKGFFQRIVDRVSHELSLDLYFYGYLCCKTVIN